MIPVRAQKEPARFEEAVRKKGNAFLKQFPKPTSSQIENRPYWREVLSELYSAYNGICAYSCQWISPPPTGFRSVEHFKSKLKYPKLAYEWSNYRLVCGALNGCKRDYEDVLDPFEVQKGWFVLKFPSLLVVPGKNLDMRTAKKVESTIVRLKLNDESSCIEGRAYWLQEYLDQPQSKEPGSFKYLRRMAPFLASELQRQDMRVKIRSIWKKCL